MHSREKKNAPTFDLDDDVDPDTEMDPRNRRSGGRQTKEEEEEGRRGIQRLMDTYNSSERGGMDLFAPLGVV